MDSYNIMNIFQAVSSYIFLKKYVCCTLLCLAVLTGCRVDRSSDELISQSEVLDQPNILWLTSEDNSPETISIYGDPAAHTPNIDRLAKQGLVFRNAFSNAPVCSVARSVLISGMHAPSLGLHHHRTRISVPEHIENLFYPHLLRQAGYYTTNNSKTDYNVPEPHERFWDESGNDAHYKNRDPGQPFFAVFNSTQSHEGQLFFDVIEEEPVTDPEQINLPDYHPDVPEIRRSWAHYYDLNRNMDQWVGQMLSELEEYGLSEDTIVMYFSDHGGVLPRSKRSLYHTGTAVALVVYVPEKWQHLIAQEPGSEIERIVNFVDIPPTIMSLVGVDIPEEYQGRAFLGEKTEPADETAFLYRNRMDQSFDMQRGVFDGRYRYIRNYMPHRPNGQFHNYPFRMPAMRAWYRAWEGGETTPVESRYWLPKESEELYDRERDPWEVNNLADDPAYADKRDELRGQLNRYILEFRDAGFIPFDMFEALSDDLTIHDYIQSEEYPLEWLIEIAGLASSHNPTLLPQLRQVMRDEYAPVRYWGALGALVLGYDARPAKSDLINLLNDEYVSVQATAAEALGRMGQMDLAVESLVEQLNSERNDDLLYSLNALAHLDVDEQYHSELLEKIRPIAEEEDRPVMGDRFEHARRIATYLLLKWTGEVYPPHF